MPTVTVDAADLETLLFGLNVVQNIEAALTARSRDPMAIKAKGGLSAAHDRLATAWRRSLRKEPDPPGDADLAVLRAIFPNGATEAMIAVGTDGLSTTNRLSQTLQLIEAGPVWPGIKIDWPAPHPVEFRQDEMDPRGLRYAARLTVRGMKALGR